MPLQQPGTNVTMEPPPSPLGPPVEEDGEEEAVTLRLVPFGATDVRISVFPWAYSSPAAAASAAAAPGASTDHQPILTLGNNDGGDTASRNIEQ